MTNTKPAQRGAAAIMLVKLAWRNLFRNKRRTFIAGSAIGIGLASLMFSDALVIGMEENLIRTATSSFMGQGQIHAETFRESRDIEKTIAGVDSIVPKLEADPRVRAFTPRVFAFGTISSSATMNYVGLWGIRPETERGLSQIDEALVEGEYFAGENPRDIVIGRELAERLEVKTGERIVVTVSRADTGTLSQELFRVSGVYRFGMPEMDKTMAFVRIDKAREMLGLADNAMHEIALTFEEPRIARDREAAFWDDYSGGGNEALGWPRLMPQFEAVLHMTDFALAFMGIVLFGIVALGIINTLFMSLYERIFEFGVLRAVGTRPGALWRMVVMEAGALALLSCVLGTVVGIVLTFIFTRTGIDYRGIEFTGVTIRELIYPQFRIAQFTLYPFFVLLFTLLVGMYPATTAARMRAADALRRTM